MLRFVYLATGLLGVGFATHGDLALAHVSAKPNEAPAGTHLTSGFTISHGCSGSPTVAVRVKIPLGVILVKPQIIPGWQASTQNRQPAAPNAAYGRTITEVDEVTWRGGPLPDDKSATFHLEMTLPDGAGKTLFFPVIQECQEGVHRWTTIPAAGAKWHNLRDPAPFIRLKPKVF